MKRLKETKGITLVVLVVTIVILLILAGITINQLTGENGLFTRAKEASEKTTIRSAEEEINIVLNEWQIEKATGSLTLEEFLDKKIQSGEIDGKEVVGDTIEIEKNGYIAVIDKEGNIIEEIQKSGPRPQISNIKITTDGTNEVADGSQKTGTALQIQFDASIENGTIKSITPAVPYTTNGTEMKKEFIIVGTVDGTDYTKKITISVEIKYRQLRKIVDAVNNGDINIGDYVTYTPNTASTTDILNELSTYSGNTDNTSNTTSTLTQETSLKWRVLDVKDGKVRLISEVPTTSTVTLYGAKGYNNAVYLLDKTCRTLYNNSTYAEKVQSLKIEDIQDHLTYDYTQYTNQYVDTGKYGGIKEYTSNRYYPNIFATEKTGWVDGTQGTQLNLSEQTNPLDASSTQASTSIKVTHTLWEKSMATSDFTDSIYYNLFINNGSNYSTYWMSSRCTRARSGDALFYVCHVGSGYVSANILYCSSGDIDGRENALRPVITLKSNVLVKTGEGTSATPYEIGL